MKKLVYLLLALLVAVLSGCDDDESGSGETTQPQQDNQTTAEVVVGSVDRDFDVMWTQQSGGSQEDVTGLRDLHAKELVATSGTGYGSFEMTEITICDVENSTELDIGEPDPNDDDSVAFKVGRGKVSCGHDPLNRTLFTFQAGEVTVKTLGTIVIVDVSAGGVDVATLSGEVLVEANGGNQQGGEGTIVRVAPGQVPQPAVALTAADLSPLDVITVSGLAERINEEAVLPPGAIFEFPPPEVSELGGLLIPRGAEIQIGSLQALSGALEASGLDQLRGVELALGDFGLIEGHDVALSQIEDGSCDADHGTEAARSLAVAEDLLGIIGSTCAVSAAPAANVISEAGGVLVSGSVTSQLLTSNLQGNANDAWRPGFYRTAYNDINEGSGAAQFAAEELGAQSVAIVHRGDPFTMGLALAFAAQFEELGGTVISTTGLNPADTDFTPLLAELSAQLPEAVYLALQEQEAPLFVQQLRELGGLEDSFIIGADGTFVSDLLGLQAAEGIYFSGPDFSLGQSQRTGVTYEELSERYVQAYGDAPHGAFMAHAYDATVLLLNAIEAAALEGPGGALWVDRQALRDQLSATEGFEGVTGTLSCDRFGDCGSQSIAFRLHEDSGLFDPIDGAQIVARFTPER